MKRRKLLYHGSSVKLIGENLFPSKGDDSKDRPENNKLGVYATDVKEIAIAMAIISSRGIVGAGLDDYVDGKPPGVIHIGKIKQKYVYLHILSNKGFKKTPTTKHQYISLKSVKPIKSEKLLVEDYKYLIRYSSKIEGKKWKEKYFHKNSRDLGRNSEVESKRSIIKKNLNNLK